MNEPRNILHVISQLDGYGTARQLRILARGQKADGSRVRIAALRANHSVLSAWKANGFSSSVLERRWRVDPFTAWRLSRELLAEPPEVVHAWDLDAVKFVAAARLRSGSVPVVATLLTPPAGSWSVNQVDRLAVGSEPLRAEYAARGVGAEHLAVVPPAVAVAPTSTLSRERVLEHLGLAADAQLIAVVGPLTRAKRFDEAIWCFELVRTLNERATLVIFGDGPDRQRLERYTRLVSEPAAVRFLGYRDNLAELLHHANVFWHPGEEPSISSAVLESMAGRVPVVASDVPGHRDLIEHGRTGFLAPVGSRAGLARHTLRLLEDSDLAAEIGRSAAAAVSKRFSATAMTAAYRDLYRLLLAKSG